MKVNQIENQPSVKLFQGERALIITGLIGFLLSAGISIFIFFNDPIIAPEGNMRDAFSFNAAIGMFILSIAAILPLSRFGARKRKVVRWLFIFASIYSYTIETLQNFRGINPRFSREGTVVDIAAGMLFGVISLVLVALTIVLMVHFLRMKQPHGRPFLIMGIRYAFLSVLAANSAGIWMILLQDRLTGGTGNLIVLHGVGFHALQTLILPAWLLEKAQIHEKYKKTMIHTGSIAWMLMVLVLGIQTSLGQSVFEITILPIIALLFFLIWFGTVCVACRLLVKKRRKITVTTKVLE
ncbi:hypothetical protein F4694_005518 [Bacillus niacini]|uniref:Uncharacterized protein n=1 Tax=Neobacillus niacini TaxID=86668 RepID=A0A852TK41_9BACI|nr:hypothetical protein [Neobacillus niacini]NYE08669.1 hypothetical protein [Neobacillus niacini]